MVSMKMTDRKSTRLNSSHITISYAVFCLKKKTKNTYIEKRRLIYKKQTLAFDTHKTSTKTVARL